MKKDLTLRELLPWIAAGLLLGLLPYLLVWAAKPAGLVFGGALINPDDLSAYLAAIRQGAEGGWLYRITFTPEAIAPRFTYPLYILLGRLAALVGGSGQLWFHLFRMLAGLGALLCYFLWVRQIFPGERSTQRSGWLLMTFGSGLGWLAALVVSPTSPLLADLQTPEWNTATTFLTAGHFILANGLLAAFFACLSRVSPEEDSWKYAAGAALAGGGVGLVYAFHVATLGLALGLYMLALARRAGRIPWRTWLQGGLVALALLPFVYYYGVASIQDPLWQALYVEANVIAPPPPAGLVVGYGLLLIMALVGLRRWFQEGRGPLVPLWALVTVGLVYSPLPYAGRYILGLHIPMAAMAAYGLENVILPGVRASKNFERFQALSPTPVATLRRMLILLTIPSTLILAINAAQTALVSTGYPFYYPDGEVEAMTWLAGETDEDDLILAYYPAGNYLPRLGAARVFIGQQYLTIDLDGKVALVETFWAAETSASWREALLDDWGVTYIYRGEYEKGISGQPITPPGEVVYQQDGVTIFRVGGP